MAAGGLPLPLPQALPEARQASLQRTESTAGTRHAPQPAMVPVDTARLHAQLAATLAAAQAAAMVRLGVAAKRVKAMERLLASLGRAQAEDAVHAWQVQLREAALALGMRSLQLPTREQQAAELREVCAILRLTF